MINQVFSVYDTKAKAFLPPFYATNGAVAGRMMQDACSDPKHPFNVHAADYQLFQVASFDDDTGRFEPLESFVNLGNLITFIPTSN